MDFNMDLLSNPETLVGVSRISHASPAGAVLIYREVSNIRRTKSHNLNASRFIL